MRHHVHGLTAAPSVKTPPPTPPPPRSKTNYHLDVEDVAQQRIERAHGALLAYEQVRVGAEGVEDARQLDGDVSRANDRHALRLLREAEEPVAGRQNMVELGLFGII